jgi:hypothetical protein
MKIFTERRVLVRLTNVPFSAMAFELLHKLAQIAPNLRFEGTEVHSSRPATIRLCTHAVNLPSDA